MELIDFELKLIKQNKKYYSEPLKYARVIKKRAVELFGNNVRVFLFGSIVKGNFTLSSDIDVLAVLPSVEPEKKSKIITHLKKNFPTASPFQIIICNEEQYNNWFKKHILDKYIEVN